MQIQAQNLSQLLNHGVLTASQYSVVKFLPLASPPLFSRKHYGLSFEQLAELSPFFPPVIDIDTLDDETGILLHGHTTELFQT